MQYCTSWSFGWFNTVQQLIIFGSEQCWVITEIIRNTGTHNLCEHRPYSGSESGTSKSKKQQGQGLFQLSSSSAGEISRSSSGTNSPSSVIQLSFWALLGGSYISKEKKLRGCVLQESEEIVIPCYNREPIGGRSKTQLFLRLYFHCLRYACFVQRIWLTSSFCSSPLLEAFCLEISHA